MCFTRGLLSGWLRTEAVSVFTVTKAKEGPGHNREGFFSQHAFTPLTHNPPTCPPCKS